MNMSNVPNEWKCPITHMIMKVPVIAEDGITYEESAIKEWLNSPSSNGRSPVTNTFITIEGLKINYALKSIIERNLANYDQVENTLINTNVINKSKIKTKRFTFKNKNYLHLKVESPKSGELLETLVIALIDISGSMKISADNNKESEYSFSRLDLVKHSLKTIVKSIGENNYLSLVPFSTNARILLEPTKMTNSMQSKCCDLIDGLTTQCATNIWDALNKSFDIASRSEHSNKNISILLFTDGIPNLNPPRGIIETMKRKLTTVNSKFNVNTFGFGYELDSKLLHDISIIGNGQFSFIPDASMVGTIFVNFLSNILLNYSIVDSIKIRGRDFNKEIIIDSLQYGQDKDYIIEIPNEVITIEYLDTLTEVSEMINPIDYDISLHILRTSLIKMINKFNPTFSNDYLEMVYDLYNEYKNLFGNNIANVNEILKDLVSDNPNEGQIGKAVFKKEWYDKWGKHYLLSIQRAHECMVCNNFKDPGVQIYGNEMFQNLRDKMEDIFCNIPPPTPSTSRSQNINYVPPNMGTYMNSGGVCFDGNSVVIMENGGIKLVKHIKKDDILFNGLKVKCVIKTVVHGEIDVCEINKMLITPWHPICFDDCNDWVFPIKVSQPRKENLDYVYNFVLESGHYCIINGIKVVTLGHDFDNNDVIRHEYYGSDLVIKDFMKFNGWNSGLIILNKPMFRRGIDGKISNILV